MVDVLLPLVAHLNLAQVEVEIQALVCLALARLLK